MPAYRADHVGSFLRPAELLDTRAAQAEGRLDEAQLREAEDRAILAVLELQRQTGLDVYSDGEYRRGMWMTGLPAAVEGFVPGAVQNIRNWRGRPLPYVPGQTGAGHPAAAGQNPAAVIGGKLVARRRITDRESAFLARHAPGPYKITIPSPTWYLRGYIKGTSDRVYPSQAEALRDLTDIVRQEVTALVGEGVPYVQIDSIRYVFDYTDEQRRREWQELGVDVDQAVDENIAADNAVIAGLPREGVTFGLHMCRGNNRSRWFAEGATTGSPRRPSASSTSTASCSSTTANGPAASSPCASSPRARRWSWASSRPRCRSSNPWTTCGAASTRPRNTCPSTNLALSPQCGFASVAAGNEISWDDQRRKLELLGDTARKVWATS